MQDVKNTPSILIMDDDQDIVYTLQLMFESLGFDVFSANCGEDTLKIYKQEHNTKKIDLVLVDLMINKGMNGQETIKKLLEFDKNVRIIISSGYSYDEIKSKIIDLPIKGFLAKPYGFADLKKLIDEVL